MQYKELIEKIKAYCKEYAGEVLYKDEGFNPQDYSGGNFDGAWQGGISDGATAVCNNILVLIADYEKHNEL